MSESPKSLLRVGLCGVDRFDFGLVAREGVEGGTFVAGFATFVVVVVRVGVEGGTFVVVDVAADVVVVGVATLIVVVVGNVLRSGSFVILGCCCSSSDCK